jgi:hypothetical protein
MLDQYTTYVGGGVYVRLSRAQVRALRFILKHHGAERMWQAFACRPSEAENIINADRDLLPANLRAQV